MSSLTSIPRAISICWCATRGNQAWTAVPTQEAWTDLEVQVSDGENRKIVERYVEAIAANDWDAVSKLQRQDYVEEWPQSGERIRGRENLRAIMENYPGGLVKGGVSTQRIVGSEDRWALSPSFTLHRIEGGGNAYTFEGEASYPSGDTVKVVAIVHIVGGQIARQTTYFPQTFDAPQWRAQWIERM